MFLTNIVLLASSSGNHHTSKKITNSSFLQMKSILLPSVLASVPGMWAVIFKATARVESREWDWGTLKHHRALCSYWDSTFFFLFKRSTACWKLLVIFQISKDMDSDRFCQDFCNFLEKINFLVFTALFSLTFSKQNLYTCISQLKVYVSY